jgi:hypothetical protein
MKVIGLGAPDDLRVRFEACEIDVLVDALRGQRAIATRAAAETYCVAPGQTRMVDDSHDRLRAIEALLIQVEEQPQTPEGAILVGNTQLVGEVVHAGAREALRRLAATHERYQGHTGPQSGDALLDAASTAKAWVRTLVAVDRVELGWDSLATGQRAVPTANR